jgi:nicotinamide riboside transporter PnuC
MKLEMLSLVLRLDCLSCVLTIFSTILVGRRCWEGWVLAAANSLIICVIGLRTAQLAFIPANLFCIVLYAVNLRTWRKAPRIRYMSPTNFGFSNPNQLSE